MSLPEQRSQSRTTLVLYCTELELDKQLVRFWKPPRRSKMSPDDEYCGEYFRKTVRRNSAGRYIVSLPIKPQKDSLAFALDLPCFETHLSNWIMMHFC